MSWKLWIAACAIVWMGGCKMMDQPKTDQPTGPVYMRPHGEIRVTPEDDPTRRDHDKPDPTGDAVRNKSLATLRQAGFKPAAALPTAAHRAAVPGRPRTTAEIAQRLLALAAVVDWVIAPADELSSDDIDAFIPKGKLRSALAPEERAILALSRDDAAKQHSDTIGWRMENMWPPAWALGFTQLPSPEDKQVGPEVMRPLFFDFLPNLKSDPAAWIQGAKLRSESELVELEDLFYCAHNAVRSAQLGNASTVPDGFHPVMHGGAVHERRHSLTWILSPGVAWDDTDSST